MLARGTAGFSGADLANLVNEAALNAARYNQKVVRMHDFEFAKDKVLMGSERRSMIISDEEKRVTAIHEAGHALLAVLLPHADPIHKVTIIPRGMALGVTQQLPADEKHNYSRDYLNDQIAILLGGRIAEEITMDSMTTGAGNDLERATELARKMVCEWGMSDAMGPLTFGKKEEQIFLGREIAQHQDYSEDTAHPDRPGGQALRHRQLRARARACSRRTRPRCSKIAEELLAREVLDAEQVRRIVAGQPLEEHKPRRRARRADDGRSAAGRRSGRRSCRRCRRSTSRCRRNSQSASTVWDAVEVGEAFDSQLLRPDTCLIAHDSPHAVATPFRSRAGAPLQLGERTLVMGILNVTPDSFADGGVHFDAERAVDAALRMVADGRRHHRRRRRVDAAGRRAAAGGRGAARACCR